MKQQFIIGNWKMKITDLATAKKVFTAEKRVASKVQGVQTVVCVPHMYIEPLSKLVSGHRCVIGAQNVSTEESGAFTGEVSASMLADCKVQYCIVGHSERRAMGETDEDISKKIQLCLKYNITPILCVGEATRDRAGKYFTFLKKQILASLGDVPKRALGGVIIAYEPIWALSSTPGRRDATPADSTEMVLFLKKVLADEHGQKYADMPTFIYGGSANKDNAAEFLTLGTIDGLLPGTASTDPSNFGAMIKTAGKVAKEK